MLVDSEFEYQKLEINRRHYIIIFVSLVSSDAEVRCCIGVGRYKGTKITMLKNVSPAYKNGVKG
jgi:hypothetical protein